MLSSLDPGAQSTSLAGRVAGWPSCTIAVVEIVGTYPAHATETLLGQTYFASRRGVVALALTDITVPSVNRMLDRYVACLPLTIPGVRYLATGDGPLLTWLLQRTLAAFGDTPVFRNTAAAADLPRGLPFSHEFRSKQAPPRPSLEAERPVGGTPPYAARRDGPAPIFLGETP